MSMILKSAILKSIPDACYYWIYAVHAEDTPLLREQLMVEALSNQSV
jgi:hypothetical protein